MGALTRSGRADRWSPPSAPSACFALSPASRNPGGTLALPIAIGVFVAPSYLMPYWRGSRRAAALLDPRTATSLRAGCSGDLARFLRRQPPITRHRVGVIRVDDASQGAPFG